MACFLKNLDSWVVDRGYSSFRPTKPSIFKANKLLILIFSLVKFFISPIMVFAIDCRFLSLEWLVDSSTIVAIANNVTHSNRDKCDCLLSASFTTVLKNSSSLSFSPSEPFSAPNDSYQQINPSDEVVIFFRDVSEKERIAFSIVFLNPKSSISNKAISAIGTPITEKREILDLLSKRIQKNVKSSRNNRESFVEFFGQPNGFLGIEPILRHDLFKETHVHIVVPPDPEYLELLMRKIKAGSKSPHLFYQLKNFPCELVTEFLGGCLMNNSSETVLIRTAAYDVLTSMGKPVQKPFDYNEHLKKQLYYGF